MKTTNQSGIFDCLLNLKYDNNCFRNTNKSITIYQQAATILQPPDDSNWKEIQNNIYESIYNNSSISSDSSTENNFISYLIKIDLSTIKNKFKIDLNKQITSNTIKIELIASGNNNGKKEYGYEAYLYENKSKKYIRQLSIDDTKTQEEYLFMYMSTSLEDNLKDDSLYILLKAGYPAKDNIKSSIQIKNFLYDLNFKLSDVTSNNCASDISLDSDFLIISKGLKIKKNKEERVVFSLYGEKDYVNLCIKNNIAKLLIQKNGQQQSTPDLIKLSDKDYQTVNFVIHYNKTTGFTVYALENQGEIKITTIPILINSRQIKNLMTFSDERSYSLLNGYYDSLKICTNKILLENFNFDFAKLILKNDLNKELNSFEKLIYNSYSNPSLFIDLEKFNSDKAKFDFDNNTLNILNSSTQIESKEMKATSQSFQLFSNNRYELVIDCKEINGECYVEVIDKKNNDILLEKSKITRENNKFVFNTNDKTCNYNSQIINIYVKDYKSNLKINSINLFRVD